MTTRCAGTGHTRAGTRHEKRTHDDTSNADTKAQRTNTTTRQPRGYMAAPITAPAHSSTYTFTRSRMISYLYRRRFSITNNKSQRGAPHPPPAPIGGSMTPWTRTRDACMAHERRTRDTRQPRWAPCASLSLQAALTRRSGDSRRSADRSRNCRCRSASTRT